MPLWPSTGTLGWPDRDFTTPDLTNTCGARKMAPLTCWYHSDIITIPTPTEGRAVIREIEHKAVNGALAVVLLLAATAFLIAAFINAARTQQLPRLIGLMLA